MLSGMRIGSLLFWMFSEFGFLSSPSQSRLTAPMAIPPAGAISMAVGPGTPVSPRRPTAKGPGKPARAINVIPFRCLPSSSPSCFRSERTSLTGVRLTPNLRAMLSSLIGFFDEPFTQQDLLPYATGLFHNCIQLSPIAYKILTPGLSLSTIIWKCSAVTTTKVSKDERLS